MQIFIDNITNNIITLNVEPSDTIAAVKAKVEAMENIVPKNVRPVDQYLVYEGRVLDDARILSPHYFLPIPPDSTLKLIYKLQIFVTLTPAKKTITLDVHSWDKVGNVKAMIQKKEQLPFDDRQRFDLVFAGKNLEDDWNLAYYKVQNGSALLLAAEKRSVVDEIEEIWGFRAAGNFNFNLQLLCNPFQRRLQSLEVLREMQRQHDELENFLLEERKSLEAKYQKLFQSLYKKRSEIVSRNGMPYFWIIAMKNNEEIADEISELDERALEYLNDINCSRRGDLKGFELEFVFDRNPYFRNKVLTKTYHMVNEDEGIVEKAVGTEIQWYPGKCLTLKRKSFFDFFRTYQILGKSFPDKDIIESYKPFFDEDVIERSKNRMEEHYKIGCIIRNKIIPHAVSWFTGEANFESSEDEEDEEEDDEEDTDDEDDEEDDDEEDEENDEEDEDENEDDINKVNTKKKLTLSNRALESLRSSLRRRLVLKLSEP